MSVLRVGVLCVCFAAVANAAISANSFLSCENKETVPSAPVTCFISARDELQEPTAAEASQFTVRAESTIDSASPVTSPITAMDDPTKLSFTVGSDVGSQLRIDVTLTSTRQPIRNSGVVIVVLAAGPTELRNFRCGASSLVLRQSVSCQGEAFAANGLPAIVSPRDIFATEDHGDGSFKFEHGRRVLQLQFTAPSFPSMSYTAFSIRVTLTGRPTQFYNATLTMLFPQLPPTARSTLQCDTLPLDSTSCLVTANDDQGPVKFSGAAFKASFEQRLPEGQWQPTTAVSATWVAGSQTASQGSLRVTSKERSKVFELRATVSLASTGDPVIGSPFVTAVGVPPTANTLSLVRCTRGFVSSRRQTTCFVAVDKSVTADPRFLSVSAKLGDVLKVYANQVSNEIAIDYLAPNVRARAEDYLSVATGGVQIQHSPRLITVYPTSEESEFSEGEEKDRRGAIVGFGLLFFGGAMIAGLAVFIRHRRKLSRVRAKHQREKEEADAAGIVPTRSLTEAERNQASKAEAASNNNDDETKE